MLKFGALKPRVKGEPRPLGPPGSAPGYRRFSVTIMQMPMGMENLPYPFALNGYKVPMVSEGFPYPLAFA